MSSTRTRAPRPASRRASSRPIPRPAPVTMMTRPSNRTSLIAASCSLLIEIQERPRVAADHLRPADDQALDQRLDPDVLRRRQVRSEYHTLWPENVGGECRMRRGAAGGIY